MQWKITSEKKRQQPPRAHIHTYTQTQTQSHSEHDKYESGTKKNCGKHSQDKHRIKQNIKIICKRQQQLTETETETKAQWTHMLKHYAHPYTSRQCSQKKKKIKREN